MTTYNVEIVINGRDRASGPLGSAGGALSRIGQIAGGILSAQLFMRIAEGILDMGKAALDSYADYERLGMALQSLVARELVNTSAITKHTAVTRAATQAEKDRAHWLGITIADDERSARKLEAGSNAYLSAEKRIAKMRSELVGLNIDQNGYISSTTSSTETTMDMQTALGLSKDKAQELLGWIQKLAIQSPFTQKDVADSFRLALAYGFTTKEAQRLVQATTDYAAGSGASSDSMNRIALALGQIRSRGKLAGQEIMQLTEAGIPVREILAKGLGITTAKLEDMVSSGLVPADKAIQIITESLEKDFGGAAKRQAGTFSGLISSLSDIKDIGLREFFTGTFQAIQPYLSAFVDKFSDPDFMASLHNMGMQLGDFVKMLLDNGSSAVSTIQDWQSGFQALAKTEAFQNILEGLNIFHIFWIQNAPAILRTLISLGNNLKTTFGPLIAKMILFATEQFKKFSAWFVQNGPLIVAALRQWAVVVGFVGRAIAGMWQFVKPILEALGALILGLATFWMQVFIGDWAGAWQTVQDTFASVGASILQAIGGFFNWIANLFGSSLAKNKAIWTSNWNQLQQIVAKFKVIVQNYISEAMAGIKSRILGAVAGLQAAGTALIEGLWLGIKTRFQQLLADIAGLVQQLSGTVNTLLGIQSPSKVYFAKGVNIIKGLANGILSGGSLLTGAMNTSLGPQLAYAQSGSSTGVGGNTYHNDPKTSQIFGVVNIHLKDDKKARQWLKDFR